jgi:hypothetical protein
MRWLRLKGRPLWHLVPSIVQHRGLPSVTGNRPMCAVDFDPRPTSTRWEQREP